MTLDQKHTETKECLYCGTDFTPSHNGRQIFCTVDHGRKYRRNQYDEIKTYGDVKCAMCPRLIRRVQPNQKYCGKECARRGLNRRRKTMPAYIKARKKKIKRKKHQGNKLWHALKD